MRTRLDELLDYDTASRWQMISISALAVAVFGGVFSGVNHKSPSETLPYAVLFGAIVFFVQVLMYCRRTEGAILRHAATILPRRLLLAAVSAGTLVLLATVPAPLLEGAVLNRRLLALTRDGKMPSDRAEKVQNCLELATSNRVHLPPATMTQVRKAIQNAASQTPNSRALQQAAKALSAYDHQVNTESDLDIGHRTPGTEAEAAFKAGLNGIGVLSQYYPELSEAGAETVSAFTRAIDLAGNDVVLKAQCYIWRGTLLALQHKYGEALADAKEAEALGSPDLSRLIPLEAAAFVGQGRAEDLTRGLELAIFAIQADLAPVGSVTGDPKQDGLVNAIFIAMLFQAQAAAYYKLGQFDKAIEVCARVLDAGLSRLRRRPFFQIAIFSLLQRGDMSRALQLAVRFTMEKGPENQEPEDSGVSSLLLANPDPKKALLVLQFRWPLDTQLGFGPKN